MFFSATATGSKFEQIGTPQLSDLIHSAAEAAEDQLDKVHDDMIEAFMPIANKLIQQKGKKQHVIFYAVGS